ncbi:unnamed protein product [Lampetra planeri]
MWIGGWDHDEHGVVLSSEGEEEDDTAAQADRAGCIPERSCDRAAQLGAGSGILIWGWSNSFSGLSGLHALPLAAPLTRFHAPYSDTHAELRGRLMRGVLAVGAVAKVSRVHAMQLHQTGTAGAWLQRCGGGGGDWT